MARSAEYPDLVWVPPRSWTNANRTAVQLVVIHDTEGSAHAQSAEDGARYNQVRTDGTSAHYFHDNNSTVQCVRTEDVAHTARRQGNLRGVHHELCARAAWPRAKWLAPEYGRPMLERAARQAARDCRKWNIPARKLTVAQVASGVKGICSHHDITRAFPQDNGTHTDPGPNFPWDVFIALVQQEIAEQEGEGDVWTQAEKAALVRDMEYLIWRVEAIVNNRVEYHGGPEKGKPVPYGVAMAGLRNDVDKLREDVDALTAAGTPES